MGGVASVWVGIPVEASEVKRVKAEIEKDFSLRIGCGYKLLKGQFYVLPRLQPRYDLGKYQRCFDTDVLIKLTQIIGDKNAVITFEPDKD